MPGDEPSIAMACVREIVATAAELRTVRARERVLRRQLNQQLVTYRAITDDAQPWSPR